MEILLCTMIDNTLKIITVGVNEKVLKSVKGNVLAAKHKDYSSAPHQKHIKIQICMVAHV